MFNLLFLRKWMDVLGMSLRCNPAENFKLFRQNIVICNIYLSAESISVPANCFNWRIIIIWNNQTMKGKCTTQWCLNFFPLSNERKGYLLKNVSGTRLFV